MNFLTVSLAILGFASLFYRAIRFAVGRHFDTVEKLFFTLAISAAVLGMTLVLPVIFYSDSGGIIENMKPGGSGAFLNFLKVSSMCWTIFLVWSGLDAIVGTLSGAGGLSGRGKNLLS
jgi:hypothetical protein